MIVSVESQMPIKVISNHGFAEIVQNIETKQNSLLSKNNFKAGSVLIVFSPAGIFNSPTYLTVQTGINKHITLSPEFLQYINHRCSPNVFFNTSTMELVALKDIEEGEEFTFFYPSTEWEMTQSCRCYCGNDNCLQQIRGAKYIKPDVLNTYKITDFIREQLNTK